MDREHWNLKTALDLCERMKSPMHGAGYLLTVYGSILCSESPRDLDLMLVPWRPSPTPPKMTFDSICDRFKLTPAIGPPYIGLMRSWSHQARDRGGRMIDFQFRTSIVSLEESYEFSMHEEKT